MQVQVLGPGCANCKKTAEHAATAIGQAGVEAEIVKVQEPVEIVKLKVMTTPGLAIDGKVYCAGRVPEVREIVTWLTTAAAE